MSAPSDDNPFASPQYGGQAAKAEAAPSSDVEQVRKKYLNHEASVKSIGLLYFVLAGWLMLATIGVVVQTGNQGGSGASIIFASAMLVGISGLAIWLALGLRKLDPRVRIPTVVFAGLSSLGCVAGILTLCIGSPVGIAINIYIMYLVLCEKGRMVFSPEYRQIIEQTPHIRYRTSWVVWALLIIVLAFLGLAFLGFMVG